MIFLDTDHLSVLTDARHALHGYLRRRLEESGDEICLPVVAVEEQLRAWLASIHRLRDIHKQIVPYDRLIRLLEVVSEFAIARWDEHSVEIVNDLKRQSLKIAAISIANDALLLSANLRDFEQVPELNVEDWLYT